MKQKELLALFCLFLFITSFSVILNADSELSSALWKHLKSKHFLLDDEDAMMNESDLEIGNKGPTPSKSPQKQPLDKNIKTQGWLSIASNSFLNVQKYPRLPLAGGMFSEILIDEDNRRINDKYTLDTKKPISKTYPNQYSFWFRLSGHYLYYSIEKTEINILDSFQISKIERVQDDSKFCFVIIDTEGNKWIICADSLISKQKWLCYLETSIGLIPEMNCETLKRITNIIPSVPVIQTVTRPYIIIPQASRFCNEKWNYKNNGKDWECHCKEGTEQSPIDLPMADQAVKSAVRPLFEYRTIDPLSTETSSKGFYKTGEKLRIYYYNNAVRIFHYNLGKIVTRTGSAYIAEEIVFHTPSEHTIAGQRYDMEMQVIHNAKTKGDIGKKAILAFLFKGKPGVTNKFLEKLDFFNLPNPLERFREIKKQFFIPHVMSETDDEDISLNTPFSFYTYQGSITEPPCSERVIVYVASEVIKLSITTLQLFKEALMIPDQEDEKGNIVINDNISSQNNRETQSLNGRTVFYFNHGEYTIPAFKKKKEMKKSIRYIYSNLGHYERVEKTLTDYLFVNGDKPSGIPNAFVVTENEAKGQGTSA